MEACLKILVTGGSGFIGRNVVEHFCAQHDVVAPTHQELDLNQEDAVQAFFRGRTFDVVIHAAYRQDHRNVKDRSAVLYNNSRMFFNIIRLSDRFGYLIYLGSGLVYDMRYYLPKMKEEYYDTHVPVDEGGFAKYIVAKYIEQSHSMVELRIFGIFGKYEDYAIRFISNMICKTLFDLPLTIKQDRMLDYIYIDDLMPVLEHFMCHRGRYTAYNVTPGRPISLRSLAEKVLAIAGKDLPIVVAQPGMGVEYSGDNTRLRAEIPGWMCIDIDVAILKLYDWYRENRHTINREALLYDK